VADQGVDGFMSKASERKPLRGKQGVPFRLRDAETLLELVFCKLRFDFVNTGILTFSGMRFQMDQALREE
jgi:hypothetical protein